MFGFEHLSFLPQNQSNGCHFAGQRQPCQRWLHTLRYSRLVELAEWALHRACRGGRALEQVLQRVAMVPVQSADVQRSPAAYHLAILVHIIGAAARFEPKPAVQPEFTLSDEHTSEFEPAGHVVSLLLL